MTYASHPYVAVVFGLTILLIAAPLAVWRLFKRGAGGPLAIYGLMIIAMVVITGVAAGLSRGQFGVIEAVNKKYASFAGLAWVGLFALLTGFARERLSKRPLTTVMPAILFMAVLLPLNVSAAQRETRIWQRMIDKTWESASAVFAQVGERNRVHDLYTDDEQLRDYINAIAPRQRGLFAHFPIRWGADVADLLQKRHQASCRSEVETLSPIGVQDLSPVLTGPGTPVSISGWAWMQDDHAPPSLVLAVDAKQRAVGAAFVTRLGARGEEWLGQKFGQDIGWFGYGRLIDPGPVTFVAMSGHGKTFCLLGGVGDVR